MIIIESHSLFYTKSDIKYKSIIKYDHENGIKYKINFIVVNTSTYDSNFRSLMSLSEIENVYIVDSESVEILKNMQVCIAVHNTNCCTCSYCVNLLKNDSGNRLKKYFNKLLKSEDIDKISILINQKNYIIFYNIVDDETNINKPIIKL